MSKSILRALVGCTFVVILNGQSTSGDWQSSMPPPLQNIEPKTSRHSEMEVLPSNYYRDVAPKIDNKAVKVNVSLVILDMKLSSGSAKTFDVDIFYYNYWTDHRLQKPNNDYLVTQYVRKSSQESVPQYKLSHNWRNRLWIPDTYFRNAIAGGVSNILSPTYYFTVTNYTTVCMTARMTLKLSCEMDFSKFPFDQHKCFFNISTTSEDINTVVLQWDKFQVDYHVDMTEFNITNIDKDECQKTFEFAVFPCLFGVIEFKRNIGHYLIKRFIPSTIIVVATFVGFWLPTILAPSRITLSITALLALVTQQVQSDLDVSYVHALLIWDMCCIIFPFASLLEFMIAHYQMHKVLKQREVNQIYRQEINIVLTINSSKNNINDSQEFESKYERVWRVVKVWLYNHFRTTTRHSSVDIIARYLFPAVFLMFVCAFVKIYVN